MKKLSFLLGCIWICLALILPIGAVEESGIQEIDTNRVPDEYQSLLESIPKSMRDLLPDELFSSRVEDVGNAAKQMGDFSYLLNVLLSLIGLELGSNVRLLASICGLLLLSAISNALQGTLKSTSVAKAFSLLSTLMITSALLSHGYQGIQAVTSYFSTLGSMTGALIPLMGVLYTLGGNVTTAVASSSSLVIYMTVQEQLIGKSIVPFCGIVLSIAMIRAIDPGLRVGTLSDTIKKNYTTFLAFLMMLLGAMLAMQTTLGAGSDTVMMRSAKFAAGNLIPIVGGSVSDLVRTVSAGVGYLRGSIGICAVILLILMLFPTLVKLFLIRLVWQITASFADLLGCESEKKLLDEMASLCNYLITAVAICSSVVLLSVSLLIHCGTAF